MIIASCLICIPIIILLIFFLRDKIIDHKNKGSFEPLSTTATKVTSTVHETKPATTATTVTEKETSDVLVTTIDSDSSEKADEQGRIKMFEDKYQWDYPNSMGYFFDRSIALSGSSNKNTCAFRQISDDTYTYTQYVTSSNGAGYIFTPHNGVGQLRLDLLKGGDHVKAFYPEKVILNPTDENAF